MATYWLNGYTYGRYLVDDEHGGGELLVELALDHLAQEALVDRRLEAVEDVRVGVGEVAGAAQPEAREEGLVLPVVSLE
eukprot:257016-Prymnesium_polylepis.1